MRRTVVFLMILLAGAGTARAQSVDDLMRGLTPLQQDEVVWLARCLYSESDRPLEQELVAWVVRNRVETAYRGRTYREVVLENRQFSAFNDPTPRRAQILKLDADSPAPAWRRTLKVALDVYLADASQRPFALTTRHFYSPVSMPGRAVPAWAANVVSLDSRALRVDPDRFLFFDNIDPEAAGQDPAIVPVATRQVDHAAPGRSSRLILKVRPRSRVERPERPTVRRPTRN